MTGVADMRRLRAAMAVHLCALRRADDALGQLADVVEWIEGAGIPCAVQVTRAGDVIVVLRAGLPGAVIADFAAARGVGTQENAPALVEGCAGRTPPQGEGQPAAAEIWGAAGVRDDCAPCAADAGGRA